MKKLQIKKLNFNAMEVCTGIPECISVQEMQAPMVYVINYWSSPKVEVKPDIQQYWPFYNDIAIIDGMALKGIRFIALAPLQQALKQMHC